MDIFFPFIYEIKKNKEELQPLYAEIDLPLYEELEKDTEVPKIVIIEL